MSDGTLTVCSDLEGVTMRAQVNAFLRYKLGLQISRVRRRGQEKFPPYIDPEFPPIFRKYADLTMIPWQGLYWSWLAARHITEHKIPGDVVECGVYKGGCSLIMSEAHDRHTWMFDTFAGMSAPTEEDYKGSRKGERGDIMAKFQRLSRDGHVDWCYGDIAIVRDAIAHDAERFTLVQGKVEDTIPETTPDQIALLRLDTDFYESTRHEMEHLYPKLSSGGLLVVDDYGAWAGARKAVDDYLSTLEVRPLSFPESHYGALMLLKP